MGARMVATASAALAVALVPSLAFAHTELVRTDPRDGARLDVTPTTLTLSFNEAVSPQLSTVLLSVGDKGDERRTVLTTRQGETPSTLTAAVPPEALPEGGVDTLWVTTYRVTSRDGHAVEGSVSFRAPAAGRGLGADDASAPTETPDQASPSPVPEPGPEVVDGSTASTSTTTSTLVIGGIALMGTALGCGLLVRARRRSFHS